MKSKTQTEEIVYFRSKKGLFGLVPLLSVLVFPAVVVNLFLNRKPLLALAIWLLLMAGIILVLFKTARYTLSEGILHFRCGLSRGKIEIGSIRSIEKKKWTLGTPAAALNKDGLLIRYNRWDELYVSPEDEQAFIAELRKRNPQIEVLGREENTRQAR